MSNVPTSAGANRGQPSATLTVVDVWYALFRHKWKVLVLSALGVAAAGVLYVLNQPPYVSEAKLLVRYVVESTTVQALGSEGQVSRPPSAAANIVNSEGEIIRSMDLCRQVAESIGPERILAKPGESNLTAAAGTLYAGLLVDVPRYSNVIKVSMTHRDPEIAQLALQKLIELYFKRHAEIHRGLGTMDAILAQQTDQVRSRLIQTDVQLQELRTKAGVLSLHDSRAALTVQMGNIRQMILTTEAELAEYQSTAKSPVVPAATNAPVATNAAVAAPPDKAGASVSSQPTTNPPALPERSIEYRKSLVTRLESLRRQESDLRELRAKAGPVSPEDAKHSYTDQIGRIRQMILTAEAELAEYSLPSKSPAVMATNTPVTTLIAATPDRSPVATTNSSALATTNLTASADRFQEYKALLARLESLHRQEQEIRNIYRDENRTLMRVREQLAEAEASRKAIEMENPSFAAFFDPLNFRPSSSASSASMSPLAPSGMQGMDPNRSRALEAKLKFLNAQLEKQRQEAAALEQFETALNQLQRTRELDEKNYRHFAAGLEQTRFDEALGSGKLANISVVQTPSPPLLSAGKRIKISGMALAAGIFGGIGLALLIELMLDHSVRRSAQLESTLALPLLFTIPRMRGRASTKIPQIANGTLQQNGKASASIPGWSHGHPLRSHIESLRDRTLMHFEGDPRKPKLIGITGCRDGAGVTTIACALAAALSETGEGRVLLINLDVASQSLHPFLIGQEACSLIDVVDAGKRETALIGNNLYVSSAKTGGTGNSTLLPTSIARILPKIKMSDYDYVVFDMPSVSPSSITGKLAGMMDLVFMVVESEKDSQNNLRRACQLLTENNAKFRIVLNKFQRYVPKWLDQDS